MKPEIKKLWVDALRGGEYKQTPNKLRCGDKFCCLGVLCNLHAQAHPEIAAEQRSKDEYMGQSTYLPIDVMNWAGLPAFWGADVKIDDEINSLSGHNDDGRTFAKIADAIEVQL